MEQWSSIPINEGKAIRVTLEVGQKYAQLGEAVPMSISLTSPAFADGAPMPAKYSAYSDNISPALQWSNLPPGTGSLALVMSDPDTPVGYIHHWILYNLPANLTGLAENLPKTGTLVNGASQISLPADQPGGYFGPRPPSGSGNHRYYFKRYALDNETLLVGSNPTRQEILSAIEAQALAMGRLVGKYAQP